MRVVHWQANVDDLSHEVTRAWVGLIHSLPSVIRQEDVSPVGGFSLRGCLVSSLGDNGVPSGESSRGGRLTAKANISEVELEIYSIKFPNLQNLLLGDASCYEKRSLWIATATAASSTNAITAITTSYKIKEHHYPLTIVAIPLVLLLLLLLLLANSNDDISNNY